MLVILLFSTLGRTLLTCSDMFCALEDQYLYLQDIATITAGFITVLLYQGLSVTGRFFFLSSASQVLSPNGSGTLLHSLTPLPPSTRTETYNGVGWERNFRVALNTCPGEDGRSGKLFSD